MQELLQALRDGVVNMDVEKVREAAQEVLDEGFSPYDAVMDGLAAGMEIVGDRYEKHEYFVPELLICADALYAGLDILKPHIKLDDPDQRAKGVVVIGTVEGDVHDIGKNLI